MEAQLGLLAADRRAFSMVCAQDHREWSGRSGSSPGGTCVLACLPFLSVWTSAGLGTPSPRWCFWEASGVEGGAGKEGVSLGLATSTQVQKAPSSASRLNGWRPLPCPEPQGLLNGWKFQSYEMFGEILSPSWRFPVHIFTAKEPSSFQLIKKIL